MKKTKAAFTKFSKRLETATLEAAQAAFKQVIPPSWQEKIEHTGNNECFSHAPRFSSVEMTSPSIIRADLAFEFTKNLSPIFLKKKTKEHFKFMASEIPM